MGWLVLVGVVDVLMVVFVTRLIRRERAANREAAREAKRLEHEFRFSWWEY